ncbi:hypothetical protein KC343_g1835 [Hortaea werneckii]|nr:hypothetical protein KC352_g5727 [Hortaea werneckii]KAI7570861.1 hypothetical protein KC317_g2114 [Hortaea werneckii]KAI7624731.1 hypothetical protein KC346_g2081 [Hortaea werneckii]KAI7635420.1 hypothetical protein KC343_g1835 [Hortaea werneckii]KAI7681267.1 hypothetical protein KC319_g1680 [Hortaea werneckii]
MSINSFSNVNPLGGLPYYRNQRQHPHESFVRQLSQVLWQDHERISSLENELRDLKTINGRSQLDIKSKDDALAKWRAHDLSVSKQLKEYDQLAKDLSRDKEGLLRKLESQPSGTQHLREQNEALKEQLADAHETAKNLKESHTQQENGYRTKIKDLEDGAARRESTLFNLRSEVEELKDENIELQSSHGDLAKSFKKLDQDMVAIKEELDREKQSNQALRVDAAARAKQAQEDSETLEMVRKVVAHLSSSLQPFLQASTQVNLSLDNQLSSNGNLGPELIAIKHAVDSILHSNRDLKNTIEASKSDKAQLQADVASATERCVVLERKTKSSDSRLSSLQSKEVRLQAEVKALLADKRQMENRMRSDEDKLMATRFKFEQAQSKASKLENERSRMDIDLREKQRNFKNMCNQYDRLKSESKHCDEAKKRCMVELTEQSKTVKRLQDQLGQCKRENEELHSLQRKSEDNLRAKQNLADAFESRVKYLDDQIDELKSDLKRKEEEMSAAREVIQRQLAARDDYIRATATPSPFHPVQSGRSTQPYSKDEPMGPLQHTSPFTPLPSNRRTSSPTSALRIKGADAPRKFSNATAEENIKVSPAPSVVGDAQNDKVGTNTRLETRDPRLNYINIPLSPQKRGIGSVHQNKNEQNPKGPKKSRSM